MDEAARLQWLVRYILPYEAQARAWLFRHVRSLCKADADDLIQEAYSKLWVLDMESIANPRAYFVTIIRNLVAEQARRAKIIPMERMGEIESLSIISEDPGPERSVSARSELEQLEQILETLPPQCRRAFELRKFDGFSIHQSASELGISDSAVEKLLSRALTKIGDALGDPDAQSPSNAVPHRDRSRNSKGE